MTTSAATGLAVPVSSAAIPPANRYNLVRWFPYTSSTIILALMVLVAAVFWQINVFELPGLSVIGIEQTEAGEVLIVFLLVFPAYVVDRLVGRQRTDEAQRVRFALAAARVGVWEWNLKSDLVTWSDTTALAFGLSPHQAPTNGRAFFALVHPDDRDALGAASDRAIADRTDLVSEFRTPCPDGMVRWVQVHARVVYDTAGKPLRMLGVNIDVSQRKALEEQLLEADRKADRLRVLRVTMRTVQDIVNNNLNQLQLLRMEADGLVPADTLKLFDQALHDTAAQLTELGNMEAFSEKPMASGPGLAVTTSSVPL